MSSVSNPAALAKSIAKSQKDAETVSSIMNQFMKRSIQQSIAKPKPRPTFEINNLDQSSKLGSSQGSNKSGKEVKEERMQNLFHF